jgi:O-antigen/teichoic acid export membrane protein
VRTDFQAIIEHIRSPLYRNSFFLMASTVVTSGLGFFFWMVVARFYTEAEVGWGSAIISAISLLALLSVPGFGAALIRFLPRAEKPQDMIDSCLTLSGLIAVAVAIIFIVGLDIWSPALGFIKENVIFAAAFVFFVLVQALSGLIISVFIAVRRADFILSKNAIFSLLKIPLPILLVLFFHTFGIAASWGIATAVALAIALFLFAPRVQPQYKPVPRLNLGIIGSMWRYSAGSYLAHLFDAAPALVLPVMVVNLLGAEQNAYFYVAWMIASLLFAIPSAVAQSLFAEGAHFEDKLWSNVGRSLKFVFLLLVPAVILVLLLGKWLLLLFGEGYSIGGLLLLRILCISSLFFGVNRIYTSTLRVEDRMRELVLVFGFITVGTLFGSYLVIPEAGMAGVGYVWLAAQGVVSIYAISAMRSRYRGGLGQSNKRWR